MMYNTPLSLSSPIGHWCLSYVSSVRVMLLSPICSQLAVARCNLLCGCQSFQTSFFLHFWIICVLFFTFIYFYKAVIPVAQLLLCTLCNPVADLECLPEAIYISTSLFFCIFGY